MTMLERAHAHAVRLGRDRIGGEELLLAVLDTAIGHLVLIGLGISQDVLVWQLSKLDVLPASGSFEDHAVTAEALDVLSSSSGPAETLIALLSAGGGVARVLGEHGVTPALAQETHDRIQARFDDGRNWGSRTITRSTSADPPADIDLLSEEIAEHRRRKEAAIGTQDFTQAAAVRDAEREVLRVRSGLVREWAMSVDPVDLAEAVVALRDEVAALRAQLELS
ncbi:hypothetical protein [Amycolatopsis pittospori]|uniref:hypothetical protein n=1 Tax=Amycolatopsis pittospori TaxID=2749434 RepID=UPI0015F08F5F|nr:hypothetical protein [Amycolatopsis pittospori]